VALPNRGGEKEERLDREVPDKPDKGDALPARSRAVALSYDPAKARAPKITAQGSGTVAERIIELARKHDVPIKEDPLLVQVLSMLEVGQTIPPQLYQMVAEVFAWLYRLDQEQQAEG
jgi:flagellar biosynthesis protein